MSQSTVKVSVFRYDPTTGNKPEYQSYDVPFSTGMSAMNVLDYIYQNLDGTLAYFDHAGCDLGICARCTGKINGKPGLLCQTIITGDVVLGPVNENRVIRDLVVRRDKLETKEKANG